MLLTGWFLCMLSVVVSGQNRITAGIIPKAGDTLYVAADNLPSGIANPASGENKKWNLSELNAPFAKRVLFLKASEGIGANAFPDATMVAQISDGIEGYYKISNGKLLLLGTYGMDPANLGLKIGVRYGDGLIERKMPLAYKDKYNSTVQTEIAFSSDDLPLAILDQIPIKPDSFRIKININRDVVVDGWGKIQIPNGTFSVLREKRTEVRQVRVDAKIGFLPWFDITKLIPDNGQLGDLNVVSYHFLSDGVKEPVAEIFLNETESSILKIQYKADDFIVTRVKSVDALKAGVYAYPNPAMFDVRFEFLNLPKGDYDVKIYDILAKEVWSKRYVVNGNITQKEDISHLRKGTYLYSLIDPVTGRILITRRLVVVKP